jgi:DNA-binding CsgD family transcriptional regulator
VPRVYEFPECHLADRLMSIAESRSIQALGAACCSTMGELTGSPTVGLYLLKNEEPRLLYSQHAPRGFLDDYKAGWVRCDPILESVLSEGRAVDGASLLGAYGWPRSAIFGLLQHWGFNHNMCGPLWVEGKIIGVFYTATRDVAAPYTPLLRRHMEMLCRAGSLALTNMMNAGHLDGDPISIRNLPALITPTLLHEKLPPRSAEVALRVCRGQTNKEIAREMGISDQTVKEHVANLCKRFGTHNRTELVGCMLSGIRRQ